MTMEVVGVVVTVVMVMIRSFFFFLELVLLYSSALGMLATIRNKLQNK